MAIVINSFAIAGIDGYQVEVETVTMYGQPSITIVGLGDAAIKESRQRLEAAINYAGYEFPKMKIAINLAPGDIKKSGSHFDLSMAVGLLIETSQALVDKDTLSRYGFIGELSFNALLRPCGGVLPMAIAARDAGIEKLIVPVENIREASLVQGIEVFGFSELKSVVAHLEGKESYVAPVAKAGDLHSVHDKRLDFQDVQGQDALVQYIVVAAAGGHNMLMSGSPGCGKSMIAKRMDTILPDMTEEEALEVTKIYSVAGLLRERNQLITKRPFRAPHHNASMNSLVGGGNPAVPGEISLAHNGVLFLDEIAEFNKKSLNALRQPMEDRVVTISRVKSIVTFPCNFMLVAAMNPCPCGNYGHAQCKCSHYEILKYRQKISGPILDRIDLQKYVHSVNYLELASQVKGKSSAELRERVQFTRKIQQVRFAGINGVNCNAQMTEALVKEFCQLDEASNNLLHLAYDRFRYSARTFHKFLKLARTFADLDGAAKIRKLDVSGALLSRDLEKDQSKLLVVRG
ncbi:MAG: YifB family Mg chelatase-like AAA ATPase [Desulfotomaculaceae bacterium]